MRELAQVRIEQAKQFINGPGFAVAHGGQQRGDPQSCG
jgi:hypothetical protein